MDRIEKTHILVTGGGAPGAAGIIEALREIKELKISSCDIRDDVIGKVLADDFFTVPPGTSANYIEQLFTECKTRKIDCIFPITTRELGPLSLNKQLFLKENIKLIVSSNSSLEIANDKGNLYPECEKIGLHLCNYEIAETKDDALRLLSEFNTKFDQFVFKPCISNGSRGFRICTKDINYTDLYYNQKPNSAHLTFEQCQFLLEQLDDYKPLLFSEFLPGEEYSIDCLCRDNEYLIIPRLRLKLNNGISVEGKIVRHKEIEDYARKLLSHLKVEGPIGIQVKMDNLGKPVLLEINPRIQGTSTACRKAGVNLPVLAYKLAMGDALNFHEIFSQIKWDTHFVRYYKEARLK
ncbi:ATP-grasp domain-containing protein [bacterium]|nr:ATP-grasp domain-containing protein [bacterium]